MHMPGFTAQASLYNNDRYAATTDARLAVALLDLPSLAVV